MDSQRWANIDTIFHAVLEAPAEDRGVVLDTMTRHDRTLRPEVERLLRADSEADGYLDAIDIPLHILDVAGAALRPGDLLGNRFRIVEEIAEGGMGHVFRAFDNELGIEIALKVIRPEIASSPEAIARFRQEVLLARSISDPHICRTFDIDRAKIDTGHGAGEIVFLTMEFLHGETLAARIKRTGRLPLDVAANFAGQIGEALRAAHKLNIVHRDMKPSNIMIVSSETDPSAPPRVVVMDFGLARLAPVARPDGKSMLTGTNRPLGTIGYMAPEQLEGAPVSPATDLYALGLILFEMVTAERIFPARDLLSDVAHRIKGPAPSPRAHTAGLPESWCRAIEACLQTSPADRPQEVDQVLALIAGRPSTYKPQTGGAGRWRQPALIATICILAVSLFVAGFRLYKTRANTGVAPGALVYLPQVRNETGDRTLDSLTELLRAGLTQSAQINLLDQGRAGDIMQQMKKSPADAPDQPTAREIAMRAGAARIVFATIRGANGGYNLDVDLQEPDTTPQHYRHRWTRTFAWRAAAPGSSATMAPELLSTVRDANDWIRQQSGESGETIANLNTPPEDVTTGNWQALAEFADAQRLKSQHKQAEAIYALQKAIQIDPGFALAYATLGDNLVAMSRPIEGYQAYQSALNAGAGQRLSRKERDFIQGSFASDTRDYTTALEAFRDYSAFYQNDSVAWYSQAFPLLMLDRPEEAIQAALRASSLHDHKLSGANELAQNYILLGDFDAERQWTNSLRKDGRIDAANFVDAVGAFVERRYDESMRLFQTLKTVPSLTYRHIAYSGPARLFAERGDDPAALRVLAEQETALAAVESKTEKASRSIDRGYILCRMRRFDACLDELRQAVATDPSPEVILWASAIYGGAIPRMPAPLARRALDNLTAMENALPKQDIGVIYTLARLRVRGEIELANGRTQEALAAFRKADALDAPLRAREYLARAYRIAAAHETGDAATQLQEEALKAYGRAALRPRAVWRRFAEYPPGFAADEMQDFVDLAKAMHRDDANRQNVEAVLAGLRGSAPLSKQ
ncbi:Serine/threonine protein kinase [Granulicella rosea]|uniref:non-specific serine/threonine protein kinase n=1 Tax=Granulicella rosea TaxID=474952 RepID=A0A239LXD2_9BACT|nr:serine/threonine-protein kinase [Granulicella rosea]SNT35015.1 Serine/threonine protein kinase [Granulicella rosea]